jgi:glycosyltransferase involved in cell wall biosynthesis
MSRETIVWNFGALHAGGGRTMGLDFLEVLGRNDGPCRHVCVVDRRLIDRFAGPLPRDLTTVDVRLPTRRVFVDQVLVPRIVTKSGAGCLVTLGNYGTWKADVPHIVFVQTPYLAYSREQMNGVKHTARYHLAPLRRTYFRPTAATASGFVVQTETMRRSFSSSWRIPAARVRVVRGSISAEFRRALEDAPPRSRPDVPLFLTASDDVAHKNLDVIPRIAAELRRLGLRARFAVTLQHREGARLRAAAAALGVPEDLELAGRLDAEEMVAALRGATGALLPSLLETMGLPYLEAQACGARIIAADRDFAREVCGSSALYFDPLDPRAGAAAAAILIRQEVSPAAPTTEIPRRTSSDMVAEMVGWASDLARKGI